MPGPAGGSSISTCVVPLVGGNPIVLPLQLCKSFTESHQWEFNSNDYHDNTRQIGSLVTGGRRTWSFARRLTPALMAAMFTFWQAHPTDAFYFYNPFEVPVGTDVGSNWSAVGAPATGRYTVVFTNTWQETAYMGRSEAAFTLLEVA